MSHVSLTELKTRGYFSYEAILHAFMSGQVKSCVDQSHYEWDARFFLWTEFYDQ